MPEGFPTCSYSKLLRIVTKYSDGPVRCKGSHATYVSRLNRKKFTIARRSKDFKSHLVRKILVSDIGLTLDQAREEVR